MGGDSRDICAGDEAMMKFWEAAALFSDCWHLYRKYYGQELSEEMCEHFIEETSVLYGKYGKQKLAKDMLLAVINEVERSNDTCNRAKSRIAFGKVSKQTNREP